MGYYKFLKDMLSPLHVYRFDMGYSNAELLALGAALDNCSESAQSAERELRVSTAEDIGLIYPEKLMAYCAKYNDLQQRREHIMALMMVNENTFSLDRINHVLQQCGTGAEVTETDEKFKVSISFPGQIGLPEDFESISDLIEKLLPCHLKVEYAVRSCTWDTLESTYATWDDIENAQLTFADIEAKGA